LDEAVEPSGEDAFQASAEVAVGLALGGSSGFVFSGFRMASEAGDSDGVQGPVEVAVTHPAEPVPGALSAAGLQGGDAGQAGEGGFVADASVMTS